MNRRTYLATTTGLLAGLAGCTSSSTSPSPTATRTQTQTSEPASFKIEDTTPDTASLDEPVRVELTITNTGGTEGTWTSNIATQATGGPEPEYWDERSPEATIPPGEQRTWKTRPYTFEKPAVLYYQIDDRPIQTIDIPASRAPIIQNTNAISEWQTFGDVAENQITEVDAGSYFGIGTRYWEWIENQTSDVFIQAEIYNLDNDRVAIDTYEGEQVTDANGWTAWEVGISFRADWEPRAYTAEVFVRDNQNDEVSDQGTVEFDVVE